jgi:hypothetical protein
MLLRQVSTAATAFSRASSSIDRSKAVQYRDLDGTEGVIVYMEMIQACADRYYIKEGKSTQAGHSLITHQSRPLRSYGHQPCNRVQLKAGAQVLFILIVTQAS